MSKTYIYTPAEPLPGHPAPEIKAMSELSTLQQIHVFSVSEQG